MSNQISLGIAVANTPMNFSGEEFEKYLLQTLNDFEVYHLEPPANYDGEVSAGIDWILISRIADIISLADVYNIASALWNLYAKTIRPLRQNPEDNQGLYISIDPEKGLQWFLGKEIDDKESFIEEFTAKVSHYEHSDKDGNHFQETVTDIKLWMRKN